MNVIVLINGREAIPVRAIPFLSQWMWPTLVARALEHEDPRAVMKGVVAHQLQRDGSHHPVKPQDWRGIASDLEDLRDRLADEPDSKWTRESTRVLPAGVFVWKDEFQRAFGLAHSPERFDLLDECPGDRELNFTPMIPEELCEAVTEGLNRADLTLENATLANAGGRREQADEPATVQRPAATGTPSINTTGLVAWQAATLENWQQITDECGSTPAAREVLLWLRKNGPRDVFPEPGKDEFIRRDSRIWLDSEGNRHTLTIKRLGTVISEWRKAGKIPARRK